MCNSVACNVVFNRGVAQRERDRLITYRSLDRNQPSRYKHSEKL